MQTNITVTVISFAIFFGCLVALILAVGAGWQSLRQKRDRILFPPPGRLIDVGGYRLHLHGTGEGGPTVLLEAGIAASSVSWFAIQRELSTTMRVCSYDRAGLAWSEPANRSRAPRVMIEELRTLLARAGETGPFIVVGHSFGGLLARVYRDHHPEEIAGLVLLDPAHTHEWAEASEGRLRMLRRGIALSRRGVWLARIGFVRLSLSLLSGGSRTLPKLMAKLSSGKGSSVPERLVGEVRKLPPEVWPAVQSHWCRQQAFESMAQHLEVLPAVAREALGPEGEAISVPLVVISASGLSPRQLAEHETVARLSSNGKHIVAEKSGHWIHLDRPDLVVATVRDVVQRLAARQ